MAISLEQKTIVELMKCCGVTPEKAIEIGIMVSKQEAAELLIDWFLQWNMEQKRPPTEEEIYQAAIVAALET